MTTPNTNPTPNPTPAPPLPGFFDAIRRTGLVRASDRWIGGVAAGLARRFGINPNALRLLFVLGLVLASATFWIYLAAWLLLPDENTGRIALQTFLTPK